MNIDDTATELEEAFRDLALREQALKASKGSILPNGECHYCGDGDLPLLESLFCCNECKADWHRLQRAKQIAGEA